MNFRSTMPQIAILSTILALAMLVGGCDSNGAGGAGGGGGAGDAVPQTTAVPPSLSGVPAEAAASIAVGPIAASYTFVDITSELLSQWETDYGFWSSIPKVATYFNNEFGGFPDLVAEGEDQPGGIPWEVIDDPLFDYEVDVPEDDGSAIVRRNEDFTSWEYIRKEANDFVSYSTYRENAGISHSARVMFNIDGSGNHEILEMVETEQYTFVKCLWWSNTSDPDPSQVTLNHIIAVSDRQSAEGYTTARMISDWPGDYTTHTLDRVPGTTADTDYFTVEGIVAEGWPKSDDAYGFFTDADYYVPTTDPLAGATDPAYAAYPDPDLLTPFFDQGLTDEMWGDLKSDLLDGMDGIELTDWDLSAFE